MNRRATLIISLLLSLALISCATSQARQEAAGPVITAVNIMDNAVELAIRGEYAPASYTVYKPADPYVAVVDLPGVGTEGIGETIVSDKAGITEVRVVRTETPALSTRVEILMTAPSDVEPEYVEGSLVLRVKEGGAPAEGPEAVMPEAVMPEAAMPEAAMMEEPMAEEALPQATEIQEVGFDYVKGTVKLVIKGNGSMVPEVFSIDERVVLDLPGVVMKAAMPEAVIAPVKAVRHGMHDGVMRLVVDLKEPVEFTVTAEADTVVIAFPSEEVPVIEKAEKVEVPEGVEERQYTGKLISLDFQDADIVPIFRFIGDVAGYNVVVHPSVSGRITLKLLNVPWDQALDIILQTFNLAKAIDGNIMTIAPTGIFTQWKEDEAKVKAAEVKAADLKQEIIRINYADANSIQGAIKGAKVSSPRGNITIDKRMNTLIVNDTEDNIRQIKELVEVMDVQKPQVMIEAKIVEIDNTYTRTLGIRWGGNANDTDLNARTDDVAGNFSVNAPVTRFGPDQTGAGVELLLGSINDSINVDLSLEALETIGKSRKLANPRVLTIDGETANIQQGSSIPVQTTTAEGTKTEFVNANLNLQVTPRITPDGYIQLKVAAANDSPGDITPGGIAINRKNVSTQAIVKDGETLVIGGIYTTQDNTTEAGVPVFHRIPLLGWLFKTRTDLKPQNELLILITPRIVKQTAGGVRAY
jgi:type IV pilus assembly protein PilQ